MLIKNTEEILKRLSELPHDDAPVMIAIDGRCGAGKTTLADQLHAYTDYPVLHLDDFFLRPEQRTAARYQEPGGNLDRERVSQVLKQLKRGKGCYYQPFDCSTMQLGSYKEVPAASVYIIEGSYSMHPELSSYYAWSIFVTVNKEEQLSRLKHRSPEKLQDFQKRWIPLEEKYFQSFHTAERCSYLLDTSEHKNAVP